MTSFSLSMCSACPVPYGAPAQGGALGYVPLRGTTRTGIRAYSHGNPGKETGAHISLTSCYALRSNADPKARSTTKMIDVDPADPATYPQYDPTVHSLPCPALAAVGDRIQSPYVGAADVLEVYPCSFYGAPPVHRGEPVPGEWDGLAYRVRSDDGVTTLDRSRLGRVVRAAA